jgi:hypothetical protein
VSRRKDPTRSATGTTSNATVVRAGGRGLIRSRCRPVEEFGKATSLLALAVMPRSLLAQAPVRQLLECHKLKQIGGLLIAVVPFSDPGMAARLAAMSITEVTQILDTTDAFAEDADRLKLPGYTWTWIAARGSGGHRRSLRLRSQVSSAAHGGVASSASLLCEPSVQPGWLIRPRRRSSSRGPWPAVRRSRGGSQP